jgi:hypothetical protein
VGKSGAMSMIGGGGGASRGIGIEKSGSRPKLNLKSIKSRVSKHDQDLCTHIMLKRLSSSLAWSSSYLQKEQAQRWARLNLE